MPTQTELDLARDIYAFLHQYGKADVNEPTEWSSPDACLLELFAHALKSGTHPGHVPGTSWESGGYGPYSSCEGRALHDKLLHRCREYIQQTRGNHAE